VQHVDANERLGRKSEQHRYELLMTSVHDEWAHRRREDDARPPVLVLWHPIKAWQRVRDLARDADIVYLSEAGAETVSSGENTIDADLLTILTQDIIPY
jgi:hypothetical protein